MRLFLGIYLELKLFVNINFVFIILWWHLLINFQGVWKPKMIENPAYFEDNNPYKMIPIVSWPPEDCLLKLNSQYVGWCLFTISLYSVEHFKHLSLGVVGGGGGLCVCVLVFQVAVMKASVSGCDYIQILHIC